MIMMRASPVRVCVCACDHGVVALQLFLARLAWLGKGLTVDLGSERLETVTQPCRVDRSCEKSPASRPLAGLCFPSVVVVSGRAVLLG